MCRVQFLFSLCFGSPAGRVHVCGVILLSSGQTDALSLAALAWSPGRASGKMLNAYWT